MKRPLQVVVNVMIKDGKVLLINRKRGAYCGLWAVPGGKIKRGELLKDAALREALEETGLKAEFVKHRGVVSEHYLEDGEFKEHFLLNICVLNPLTKELKHTEEGNLKWFDLFELNNVENIVPSDLEIINKMILRNFTYFSSMLEKKGNKLILKKFEE